MLEDLSHHILDIAENGVNAGADEISISIDDSGDMLLLSVRDNGRGMTEETVKAVVNPFYTTRTERRVGLGLPFLKQLSELCGGDFSVSSEPGRGTHVTASFLKTSIDLPPLGDVPSTLMTLFIGNPGISWKYTHSRNGKDFSVDSKELSEALGGENAFLEPALALGVKEYIETNIDELYE
jgi:anti-sigma regulatory factor (Ser/Thr protein kinase)